MITDAQKIQEVLTRGVEAVYPDLRSLEKVLKSGRKLKLYCGYDPSSPSLHIGHAATLRKLAQFQALGHETIMLIGDFTGMIGDPTDKSAARKKLTREEVLRNAKNYQAMAGKILNFTGANPAKIVLNSQWSDKLSFVDLIDLASHFTVQQMIVREMFRERIKNKKPIYLHEFLYPLAQAYDSVALGVDLEVGGKDQIFNMLCGRELTKVLKNKGKFVLATKLLVDPQGKKMGKSEGNMINLNEKPEQMYGKIMAWPDSIVAVGFELLTDLPLEEIKKMHPKEAKSRLASEVVRICHNRQAAFAAQREFNQIFKEKKLPSKIPTASIREKKLNVLDLLVKTKLAPSKSEAKRLIGQNGAKIQGKIQKDWKETVKIKKGMVIQAGKRRFVKIN